MLIFIPINIAIYREYKEKFESLFTFIANIIIIALAAYLIKISDIKAINNFLNFFLDIQLGIALIITILFIKEIIYYTYSRIRVIKIFKKLFLFYLSFCLFTFISLGIEFERALLLIAIMILVQEFETICSCKLKNKNNDKIKEDSDIPISDNNLLLPTRTQDLNNIKKILKRNNYREPFALLINGDWGVGKTSLVNVLIKDLKVKHHIIFIQPLVNDSIQKMLDFFFKEFETILYNNGIYVGKESTFNKYFEITMQTINTMYAKNILKIDSILKFLKEEQLSQRDYKKLLEIDLEKLLGNDKKIYIIIDDLDRVEEETIKSTLIFIKEIVDFKGIDVIFLMDDRKFENMKIQREYLDKFINQKYHLLSVPSDEIFNYFLHYLENQTTQQYEKNILLDFKKNIGHFIKDLEKSFDEKIVQKRQLLKNEEKGKNIDKTKTQKELQILENSLKVYKLNVINTRKVKKIIREIKNILLMLSHEKESDFLNNINLISNKEYLIFRLALTKIVFPEIVDNIIAKGDFEQYLFETLKIDDDPITLVIYKDFNISRITDKDLLQQYIINGFVNGVLLQNKFPDPLFSKLETRSKKLLKKLEDKEILIDEIPEVQQLLFYERDSVNKSTFNNWVDIIIDLVVNQFINSNIQLKDINELLSKTQRNIFVGSILFWDKLGHILCSKPITNNEYYNEINTFIHYIGNALYYNDLNYLRNLHYIFTLKKLETDENYDYTIDFFRDVFKFDEACKIINKHLGENIKDYTTFEKWLLSCKKEIFNNSNPYLTDVLNDRIDLLIEYSNLQMKINIVNSKLIDLVNNYKKHEDLTLITNLDELTPLILKFYKENKDNTISEYNKITKIQQFSYNMRINLSTSKSDFNSKDLEMLETLCTKIEPNNIACEDLLLGIKYNLGLIKKNLVKK